MISYRIITDLKWKQLNTKLETILMVTWNQNNFKDHKMW